MAFSPVIKWTGSKRSQASFIASIVPQFDSYFEPFVGGGSVAYAVAPRTGTCGDICEPLIELWNEIKERPEHLSSTYREDWQKLQDQGPDHYYDVRARFNKRRDPASLMFLSRTCVNGLIRFNAAGEFNNSFHLSRPGIHPDRLDRIIHDWSERLGPLDFRHGTYLETAGSAGKGDFVYLDPPYMNTVGRYYGTSSIDFPEFFDFLEELNRRGAKWALSFDGSRGDREYEHSLPEDLYSHHFTIDSGQSAFKRVLDGKVEVVRESLYTNYVPEA